MCSLVNFKSRKFAFLGTLLMAIPLLIFASEVGAGEQKLQGSNHTSSEIAAACVLAGVTTLGRPQRLPPNTALRHQKAKSRAWGTSVVANVRNVARV